ncbi:hypothetical protein CBR_g38382 [Chara braunii]|uniref:Uncharacterized protein n=1 Tax=Chara braunii TaxID=69332 RepID=A0A388JNM7_CHABU|nr:hypothetical protein CBR_g38382 [Chara braunii]|eukprot:GBG59353.1 hypothetical protein CBR_g38382 [Chara braunii]
MDSQKGRGRGGRLKKMIDLGRGGEEEGGGQGMRARRKGTEEGRGRVGSIVQEMQAGMLTPVLGGNGFQSDGRLFLL